MARPPHLPSPPSCPAVHCVSLLWPLCRRGPTLIKTHTFVLLCWQILHFPNLIGGTGAAEGGFGWLLMWTHGSHDTDHLPVHPHTHTHTRSLPPPTICVTVFEKCYLTRLKWANALCGTVNMHTKHAKIYMHSLHKRENNYTHIYRHVNKNITWMQGNMQTET